MLKFCLISPTRLVRLNGESMTHWKLLISITLLASCGQLGLQAKKTAKMTALQTVQEAQYPDQELTRLTQSKYVELHYLQLSAYAELEAFDQSLESGWQGLAESVPYSKLVAIRMQVESVEDDIQHIQQDLLARAQDEGLAVSERMKALTSLEKTLPSQLQVQGPWLYTLWRQHHRNKVLARHLMLGQGKAQEPEVQAGMEKIYLALKSRYGVFEEHDHAFTNWKQLIHKEQVRLKSDDEMGRLAKTIDHAAHEIRFERQKLAQEQTPHDKNFRPSTTMSGNVTGDEFPSKVWAMTFNDGPIPGLTNKLVDQMVAQGQQATFFQLSKYAAKYPRTAKYVRSNGMEIAAHGEEHVSLVRATAEERDHHIRQAAEDLSVLHGGTIIRLYRLPFAAGLGIRELRARIANAHMIHASWNVDAMDWQAQPSHDIALRVIKQMNKTKDDAGMIAFHESHELSVAATREVLQHMKNKNHRACALSDIIDQMNRKVTVCPVKVGISAN